MRCSWSGVRGDLADGREAGGGVFCRSIWDDEDQSANCNGFLVAPNARIAKQILEEKVCSRSEGMTNLDERGSRRFTVPITVIATCARLHVIGSQSSTSGQTVQLRHNPTKKTTQLI